MPVAATVITLVNKLQGSIVDSIVLMDPYRSSCLAPCQCLLIAVNSVNFSVAEAVQAFALSTD